MLRGLAAVGVALSVATLAGAGVDAGIYNPPPGDGRPVWSPDGSVLVYATTRAPRGVHVVRPDGVEEGTLPGVPEWAQFAFSPDWRWIAYASYEENRPVLVVSRPDGSERRVVAERVDSGLSWSPDGRRIAFARSNDPRIVPSGGVYTIEADGSGLRTIAASGYAPAFSPDGSRIAYVTGQPQPERWDVAVVPADGGTPLMVTRALADAVHTQPAWSRDGSRLAFVGRGYIGVIGADGTRFRRYRLAGQAASLEWSRDGRSLLYSGFGVFRLDLATGRNALLLPYGSSATFSPDGRAIAFAGGGECKDRVGIYLTLLSDGRARRITNDCRITGTAGADTLVGTELADVLLGLGGNDVLTANDAAYVGDDLYGGAADDVLNGNFRSDVLDGGEGNDRVVGNAGPDTVRGGPGRDLLSGGGGKDALFSEDARRDRVSCGTSRPGNGRELDTAFADRLDQVSPDCELLYRDGRADLRRGRTRLTIGLRTTLHPRERPHRWTLRCNPAGGTLPNAGAACRRLATMRWPLAPVAPGTLCAAAPPPYDRRAQVEGVFAGKSILVLFSRYSSCDVYRWNRHRFLFPG